MTTNPRRLVCDWGRLLLLTAAYCLTIGFAGAQESPPRAKPPAAPAANQELRVFTVKHIPAGQVAQMLDLLYPDKLGKDVRLVPDMRGSVNRLIVRAGPEQLALVRQLIQTVDAPSDEPSSDQLQVRVYPLKHIKVDQALQQIMQIVTEQQEGGFALDRQRNVVVVRAHEGVQDTIGAMIQRLDQAPEPAARRADLRVRIVWLVSSQTGEDGPDPPEDLKDVLAELAKIGFQKPRLAAQTIVNAASDTPVQAQGVAKLDQLYNLNVSGTIAATKDGHPELQLTLNAVPQASFVTVQGRPVQTNEGPLCKLDTKITIPLGHYVVLGMTPSKAMTSAFVVQVLPQR
jgi:hypothetical protein